MTDTTLVLNSGSGGTDLAGDDDATTGFHQYLKLKFGASGTQTTVTSSVGLPVNIVQDSLAGLTVNLSATDNAVLDSIDTAVNLIDNAVSGAGFNITQFGGAAVPIGAGVEATAVRVTLATDSTGVVSIDDNSGSITVDNGGTFATQVDGAALTALQLIDNTVYVDDADWTALTSSHNLIGGIYQSSPGAITDGDTGPIRLTSAGAVHVSDAGGSLTVDNAGLTELAAAINGSSQLDVNIAANALNSSTVQDDAAYTTGADYLTAIGAVRDDSLTTLTPVDGDYVPLRVNSTGALHVTGGGGGTEYNEDDASANPIVGSAILMERDDALTTVTPIEGDWIGLRGSAEGALWTQDFNSDAILALLTTIDADTGNLSVVGGGTEATAIRVTLASDSTGVLSVDDNGSSLTVDNAALSVTGGGVEASALRVTIASDSTGVLSIDDNGGAITVDNAGTFATQINGSALTALQLIDNPIVAHDAAASGSTGVNMAGAVATNSIEGRTQVANNDASRIVADLNGVIVTRPHTTLEENISERVSNTDGASTATTNFAAAGAGIHNYITSATVYNSSATAGYVDLRDGTAGSVVWTLPAPATGGCIQTFDPPLKFSANTAVAYDASAALSTIYLSLNGFSAQG